jgi:hypothetical protein
MNSRLLSLLAGCCATTSLLLTRDTYALDQLIERALVTQVTHYTCSDGGEWLRCYRQDPKDCRSIANNFVAPCVAAIARPVNSPMSEEVL